MHQEERATSLPSTVREQPDSLKLALELQLNDNVQTDQLLEVAISGIIKTRDGAVTHWALTHPGPQPDLYRRDSFILNYDNELAFLAQQDAYITSLPLGGREWFATEKNFQKILRLARIGWLLLREVLRLASSLVCKEDVSHVHRLSEN